VHVKSVDAAPPSIPQVSVPIPLPLGVYPASHARLHVVSVTAVKGVVDMQPSLAAPITPAGNEYAAHSISASVEE
jgi:hypothetical protein